MKVVRILVALCVFVGASTTFAATKLKICTDNNFWYPFTFSDETKTISKGHHVDIARKAAENLGYDVVFEPVPWKRCLKMVEVGNVDAVVSASYKGPDHPKDPRAKYMWYPSDAATAKKSNWRLTQAEYRIVTLKSKPFDYGGDVATIPSPVRVPSGYSIIDGLVKKGLKVATAKGDYNNFKKLMRDKSGSVITITASAQHFNEVRKEFKGKLHIAETPYKSKSYYMTFSRKSGVMAKEETRKKFWEEIIKVRSDKEFMASSLAKY